MSKYKDCPVCGVKFEFCGKCKRVPFNELWRNIYCSKECCTIFDTCRRYMGGSMPIEEAYNNLISSKAKEKNLQMSVKNAVNKIMEYKPQAEEKTESKNTSVKAEERPRQRRPRRRKPKNNEE